MAFYVDRTFPMCIIKYLNCSVPIVCNISKQHNIPIDSLYRVYKTKTINRLHQSDKLKYLHRKMFVKEKIRLSVILYLKCCGVSCTYIN